MTDIDPDVELVARAIAAADGYVNDGWRLCVPAAERVAAELGKAGRLAPVGDWEWGYYHVEDGLRFARACDEYRDEAAARRWVVVHPAWKLVRRRAAGPWEEVGLDPDVRADIADDAAYVRREDR